jgi:hypothetical protein
MAADDKPVWLIAQGVNSEVLLPGLLIPHNRVEAGWTGSIRKTAPGTGRCNSNMILNSNIRSKV